MVGKSLVYRKVIRRYTDIFFAQNDSANSKENRPGFMLGLCILSLKVDEVVGIVNLICDLDTFLRREYHEMEN